MNNTPSTLNDWLDYASTLHTQTIDLGLDRLLPLASELKLLNPDFTVITVAGTNGKGSSIALLESIYLAAGYQVCTVTSPELLIFNERLRVNGQNSDDETLCRTFSHIERHRKNTPLTFFEFITLASLLIIHQQKPDVALLEIGLGGRLDAINIIDADASVITSIDLDHMGRLGNTREKIGFEKAGILRAGKPFICGDLNPPRSVTQYAKKLGTKNYYAGKDFSEKNLEHLPKPHIALQNAATVLATIDAMQTTLAVSPSAIAQGLRDTHLSGRFQVIPGEPTHILDVAHNEASAILLAHHLKNYPHGGKIIAVFAMLKDKDIAAAIAPLIPLIHTWYSAGLDEVPRGASAKLVTQHIKNHNIKIHYTFKDVKQAYEQAIKDAHPNDTILVFGSFHTVRVVLNALSS